MNLTSMTIRRLQAVSRTSSDHQTDIDLTSFGLHMIWYMALERQRLGQVLSTASLHGVQQRQEQ